MELGLVGIGAIGGLLGLRSRVVFRPIFYERVTFLEEVAAAKRRVTNNNVVSLQRRGMVFIGCHDTVHATARSLTTAGGDADIIAAEPTNNLIPGVVLVPSVVAFLVELQQAGFTYAKGA